ALIRDMRKAVRLLVLVLCLGMIGLAGLTVGTRSVPWNFPGDASAPPRLAAPMHGLSLITDIIPIRRGDTLGDLLARFDMDPDTRTGLIAAIRKAFDIRKFREGSHLTIGRTVWGTVEWLEYVVDPDHKLSLTKSDGAFVARMVEIPGTIRLVRVCGTLQSSLVESVERTGERPELAFQIAEVFAWSLDFYTDPRAGDEYCVLAEKKVYEGERPATVQRILSARYVNAGTVHDAYLFPDEDGTRRYYAHNGQPLQSAFLRSPLRFEARVSSHFSRRRLHPILRSYRPHLGSDYAAPAGTPVQAIGAGRVVFSGFLGDAGNLIRIAHPAGYETQYLHLSRRLVRTGESVTQGQRIGLVGATGLATGPHLDFRIQRNGRFMDFERITLPPAAKLGHQEMTEFALQRDRYVGLMSSNSPLATTVVANGISPAAIRSNP
ncbi:MAG: peptidoglycan DD-metalloendopeptidase family protein, partial [Terriglobia bacterium]